MAERARITDIEALKELKIALLKFAEEVGSTISGVDSEVQRVGQWLTGERPAYWKHEIRKREDRVQQAKAVIAAKQLAQAPNPVSVAQERKDLQREQNKLEEGLRRQAAVKRWAPVWDREAQLYKSSCSGLGESLQRDIPMGVSRLERMMKSLEDYLRVTGVETAEQLSAGLDGAAEAAPGEERPKYAHLRDAAPGWAERAALPESDVKGLRWSAGELGESEGVSLSRLTVHEGRLNPAEKVVFAWRTLESASAFWARLPREGRPEAAGADSGWYLGPLDRPEATGGLRATTLGSLTAEFPWMAPVFGLEPGTLVVMKAGAVAAVLDGAERDVWSAGQL